jgi:hypothetical protein
VRSEFETSTKCFDFLPASLAEAMGMKYSSTPSKTIFLDQNENLIRPEIGHTVLEDYAEGKKTDVSSCGEYNKGRQVIYIYILLTSPCHFSIQTTRPKCVIINQKHNFRA